MSRKFRTNGASELKVEAASEKEAAETLPVEEVSVSKQEPEIDDAENVPQPNVVENDSSVLNAAEGLDLYVIVEEFNYLGIEWGKGHVLTNAEVAKFDSEVLLNRIKHGFIKLEKDPKAIHPDAEPPEALEHLINPQGLPKVEEGQEQAP